MLDQLKELPQCFYADKSAVLLNGDCREILPKIADASVQLVATDPPYGHRNNGGTDLISCRERALGTGAKQDDRPIAHDGEEAGELVRWMFGECPRLLEPGCCCCCCCGGGGPDPQFARWSLWLDETPGIEFKQMVVWDKGPMGMGWHYRRSYETVLVATRKGSKCRWFDETNQVENIIRPGMNGIRKIIPSESQHPTPKPVELMEFFIRLHTRPGDIVLDPFSGGGTTLVAAKNLGRRAIGIELEKRWCEMAVQRLQQCQPYFF